MADKPNEKTQKKKRAALLGWIQKSDFLNTGIGYFGGKLSVFVENKGVLDAMIERGWTPSRFPIFQEFLEFLISYAKGAVGRMKPGLLKRVAGILSGEGHQIVQRLKRKTDNVESGREVLRPGEKSVTGQAPAQTVQVRGIGAVAALLAKVNTMTLAGKDSAPDVTTIRILNYILDDLYGADKIAVCTILSGWKHKELSNLQYYCDNGADLARILGIELTHAEKPEVAAEAHVDRLTKLMATIMSLETEVQIKLIELFKLLTTDDAWQKAVAILSGFKKAELKSFAEWDPAVQHKTLGIAEQQTDTTTTADAAVDKVKSMWSDIQAQLKSWVGAFEDHLDKVREVNAARVVVLDEQCEQAWALVANTGGD